MPSLMARTTRIQLAGRRRLVVVSMVFEGERNEATDFEFLPDGRIPATARLEGNGNPVTSGTLPGASRAASISA